MLFNSYIFILAFLPAMLAVYWVASKYSRRASLFSILVMSLVFYSYWHPRHLWLILGSIVFNYYAAKLFRYERWKRAWLAAAVAANLLLIAYFKYGDFVVGNVNSLFGADFGGPDVALPLAISFFTFQQIAYLADVYTTGEGEDRFSDYCLFVSFFPQLIAGPIVHHDEVLPQFKEERVGFVQSNLAVGLTFLALGLFKKVVIADTLSTLADPIFETVGKGRSPEFFISWAAMLAYTLQIYFDFSAYSDMAIGLARMFNIKLPLNFDSPYKAVGVIDFWRRWHITLSRFLRDYLYIPLGGNRKGKSRRFVNVMITMVLGGLWHGAAWTFVLWGTLHGVYLCLNHAWRRLAVGLQLEWLEEKAAWRWVCRLVTLLAVMIGWVLFRAKNFASAKRLYSGMLGQNGWALNKDYAGLIEGLRLNELATRFGLGFTGASDLPGPWSMLFVGVVLLGVQFLPNLQELLSDHEPALGARPTDPAARGLMRLKWRPSWFWSLVTAIALVMAMLNLNRVQEFIYFQF